MLPSENQQLKKILQTIHEFFKTEVHPIEIKIINGNFRKSLPLLNELRKKVKEMGLWAPHVPKEYGGELGLSLLEFAEVSEALGRSPIGHYLFNCQAPDIGNMEILMEFGTEEQKKKYLLPLINGDIRSCFSMTEPEYAGSNPLYMDTTAVKEGSEYVINGHKWFTTAADGSAFAVVMAVTDSKAVNPYAKASQIIVPTDTPGFKILRNTPIMGHEGEDHHSHSEIMYENVRVPLSSVLGKEGSGFAIAQARLGPGRIHHCMRWIGICERAFELMCQRAVARELSPGKPLATRQMIQDWIAECRAEINASRLLVIQTAAKIDKEGTYAARTDISVIKFYVSNVLHRVLDRAIQTHGALGITDYTPLAFWYRNERAARIYDGPDEVHKATVAKHVLRSYGLKL